MTLPPRRMPALVLGCALLGAAVAGCGSGSARHSDGTLTVGLVAEPATLDFSTTDGAAIPQALLGNVYEGLVSVDQHGKIQPRLAERYERSSDGRTYTFHLRKNVKFSNGAPFTADDAVFSINRVKTQWKLKIAQQMAVVDRATKVNADTVTVKLKRPSNNWLYSMTSRIGAMYSRTGVADLKNHPVGTGPFTLGSWQRGDELVLRRNADYWGHKPQLNQVTLKYFKDAGALNNAMLAGDVNVVGAVQAPETLARFNDESRFRVIEGSSTAEVVLAMNNSRKPFNDKRVRQAVRYAIDHEALLKTTRAGRGTLIGSQESPTDPWYAGESNRFPYDPAKAKRLIKEAGAEGTVLKMRIPNLPYAVSAAQVVKDQLAQVGLKADIELLEFPARWLSEVFNKADYDLSIIAHNEPRDQWIFADPDYYFRWNNPAYAKLLEEADAGSPQEENGRYRAALRMLSQDAAADWLYLMPNLMVADTKLAGLPVNQVGEGLEFAGVRWSGK
ncbi:ABC transporter substrate-binding protein [Streptomyces sp. MUSC 14]|uniref:ABC transporter substrate-binding protein n=1 Tax=Streptomyces sp. MUSC 14 TaxID=1354889 RepID=UPI000A8000BC|nr:ABC transporter substrate-binding protein [Streptomyces sp. MUSC 14]